MCPPVDVVDAETDGELVRGALRADARATRTLFLRHAPRLLRVADRMLLDRNESEDVVQDAFERALRSLASLKEPDAFAPWMLSIVVRLVHRRFRKRRLLAALGFVPWGEGPEPLELQAAPHASAEQRAELALVDAALRRLPAAERVAWCLRHVEGLELSEVAAALGTSLTTAKRRISAGQAEVDRHVRQEAR